MDMYNKELIDRDEGVESDLTQAEGETWWSKRKMPLKPGLHEPL